MSATKEAPAILDAEGLRHWCATARPGEVLIYHQGRLAADRLIDECCGRHCEPLHSLAKAALRLSDESRVHLVQRRLAEGRAEYLCIKASPEPKRNASRVTDRRLAENRSAA